MSGIVQGKPQGYQCVWELSGDLQDHDSDENYVGTYIGSSCSLCILCCGAEMFHPPKIPQRQWNGNGTGFQRVPVENPLNADVAPIADPFFQLLLTVVCRCWFNGRC